MSNLLSKQKRYALECGSKNRTNNRKRAKYTQ